jgi:hypothetical protein
LQGIRLIKLFIAQEDESNPAFLSLTVGHIRDFIRQRLDTYKDVKYRDRHFFPSEMLQNFIDGTHKT